MTAALGTNVTVECVADLPTLVWSVNGVQLLDQADFNVFAAQGVTLEVGETESVGDNYRSTLTIPATEQANRTIREIVCQAGQSEFALSDGPPFTFTVYGQSSSPALYFHVVYCMYCGTTILCKLVYTLYTSSKSRKISLTKSGSQALKNWNETHPGEL